MSPDLKAELAALKRAGKDAKSEFESVSFSIPRSLMNEFRKLCEEQGVKYSQIVAAHIRAYVRDHRAAVVEISRAPRKLGHEE